MGEPLNAFNNVDAMIASYRRTFSQYGDSPAAVQWPRARQDLRFHALTNHIRGEGFSVLDFGCGLAHLKPFLDLRHTKYRYIGVDLVSEFIGAARLKYPAADFRLLSDHRDFVDRIDHVVASGTFNIVYGGGAEAHKVNVRSALTHLFSLCQRSLAVNFMTDQVDFRQPNAHHESVEDVYRFLRTQLSPRLILDQSYMPYEFTAVVFKDSEIMRPDNIYRNA